jgi:unsaturated rhamnogalacturonyl hydrolase
MNDRLARQERVKKAMMAMQRFPWEQGVASQAMLELGDEESCYLMARDAVLRQSREGRLGVAFTRDDNAIFGDEFTVADPASNGEAVLHVARTRHDASFEEAALKQRDFLLHTAPRCSSGVISHVLNKRQVWIDSMFMALPFLALSGSPREAVEQVDGFRAVLWNDKSRLFSHVWDDEKKSFVARDFWGVGNGWAAAGMAKLIRFLPATMESEKKKLRGYVVELLDGCLAHRTEDGLFHNVVDDRATFVEVNLAQMLCYTIYSGACEGWLDAKYVKHAEESRATIYSKVDEHGLVHDVCGAPTFAEPGTAVEGQAFFLLMETAAMRWEARGAR